MLILHAIPDFASTIPHLVLADAGVPFRIAHEDFDGGTLDTPAYRAINPHGLIPALETPDGAVFETAAILLWLADRHPGLAPAPGDPGRAAFLSWFLWTANTLHPLAMQLVHPERPAGEAAADAAGQVARDGIVAQLARLEAVAASAPGWLTADRPSILVPYLAVLLRWVQVFAQDPALNVGLATFPALRALLANYEVRPAVQRVAEAEGLGPTPFSAPAA